VIVQSFQPLCYVPSFLTLTFRKAILDIIKENKAEAYIPVSEVVYKIDESKYSYSKDSDQWFCENGNSTVDKKKTAKKDGRQFWLYKFNKDVCRNCPYKEECINKRGKAKTLEVSINTAEFYEYSQRAKTPEFLDKYKNRACQEWKNGEMKRFHGLNRAKGYGLRSMSMQSKLTALAVNLKRIARLVSSLNQGKFHLALEIQLREEFFRNMLDLAV
jgi:hypothetical protein